MKQNYFVISSRLVQMAIEFLLKDQSINQNDNALKEYLYFVSQTHLDYSYIGLNFFL